MKYGYLYYRKGLLKGKRERPMNLGDPFQSMAVLGVLEKAGIPKEDIIPVDRYDLATYVGEEVILLVNGPESYEHYAYHTRFLPVSEKIIPVFVGIHLHRDLSEEELASFRQHQPIGCRDEYTLTYLQDKGIDAFLTGCLTLTFPRRVSTEAQSKVFLVDVPDSVMGYIPDSLMENAISLSQVIRLKSTSNGDRLTDEETELYIKTAEEQLYRLRDEASLVITSRLHVATPCAAMGIPVVLVRDVFDGRYRFIDRFVPLYTPEKYPEINWQPTVCIDERVKETIVSTCKALLDLAVDRERMKEIYSLHPQKLSFNTEEEIVVRSLAIGPDEGFTYAIWGVCMPNSYLLYEAMQQKYKNAKLICAIDTWAEGVYKDSIPIISPDDIEEKLDGGTIVLVVAPAAHEDAVKVLDGRFDYVLIKGAKIVSYDISER